MVWAAVVSGVVGVAGAAYNARQGRRAAAAANQGADMADPFAAMRPVFQEELLSMFPDLMDFNPSALGEDPGFQFEMAAGEEAVNNAMGSQRLLRSGTRPLALSKFASGLAHTRNQQRIANKMQMLQILAGLAGANSGSPAAAGQLHASGPAAETSMVNSGINAAQGALPALANAAQNWNQRNAPPAYPANNATGNYGAGTPGGNWDGPG